MYRTKIRLNLKKIVNSVYEDYPDTRILYRKYQDTKASISYSIKLYTDTPSFENAIKDIITQEYKGRVDALCLTDNQKIIEKVDPITKKLISATFHLGDLYFNTETITVSGISHECFHLMQRFIDILKQFFNYDEVQNGEEFRAVLLEIIVSTVMEKVIKHKIKVNLM